MAPANQLSRGAVLAFSLVFIAFGFFPILLAAGVVRSNEGPAPRFALAAAGTLFICFGLNMIVDSSSATAPVRMAISSRARRRRFARRIGSSVF